MSSMYRETLETYWEAVLYRVSDFQFSRTSERPINFGEVLFRLDLVFLNGSQCNRCKSFSPTLKYNEEKIWFRGQGTAYD